MAKRPIIVTIDGPAGSGKSTAARLLARRLSSHYLDTGAIYRVLTLAALNAGVDLDDEHRLVELFDSASIVLESGESGIIAHLDGQDVTRLIRNSELTENVRRVARHPAVRGRVTQRTRTLARGRSVVVEGRDQGTVVFPQADVKFYLDARLDVRALRRHLEMGGPQSDLPLDEVSRQLARRDESDLTRPVSPLKQAPDAIRVDTSELTIDQMIDTLSDVVTQKTSDS